MKGNFGSSIIVRLMKAVKVFKIKKKTNHWIQCLNRKRVLFLRAA